MGVQKGMGLGLATSYAIVQKHGGTSPSICLPVQGHCKSIVALAEQLLGKLGYRVVTKMNPVEALEAFRSNPDHFHAVITDMTMPQMTGAQLAQKLMEIRKNIPIIICTGYSSMMNAEKARAAGIADYLMKPVDMRKMAQTIRKVLDQRES